MIISITAAAFLNARNAQQYKPSGPAALLGQKKVFRLKIDAAFRTFVWLIRWRDRQFLLLDLSLTNVIIMPTGMFGIQRIIFKFENHGLLRKSTLQL